MKIVIIGTGNVAEQMGIAFLKAKYEIIQVVGRNTIHSKALAEKLQTDFTTNLQKINREGEIYIVAVTDAAITKILKELNLKEQLVVHTSGSVSITVFGKKFLNHGVFYPVQTISKNSSVNFRTAPICIEANNNSSQKKLVQLAKSISNEIVLINSEQRSVLHLAAVFVNNFTNHLFTVGEHILKKNNLSYNLLKPLINETINKVENQNPSEVQTGPAVRGDNLIIERHLKMLKKYPAYKKIYKDITESIQQIKK
ncbi:MAG: DUF2520 domain-containing protein [Bacteroidia bacterium]